MVISLLTIDWWLLLKYMFLRVIVGFGIIVECTCVRLVLASENAYLYVVNYIIC